MGSNLVVRVFIHFLCNLIHFVIFPGNLVTYDDTMRRFSKFLIFFKFFMPVSKCGQNGEHDRCQLVGESWKFFDVSLIKQILMYLEMIFGKNKEQTTRQLKFKFDPLLVESAGICLFHERWIKTFYTRPFGHLCINMSQYFRKLIWYNFAIIIWQVLHKKT